MKGIRYHQGSVFNVTEPLRYRAEFSLLVLADVHDFVFRRQFFIESRCPELIPVLIIQEHDSHIFFRLCAGFAINNGLIVLGIKKERRIKNLYGIKPEGVLHDMDATGFADGVGVEAGEKTLDMTMSLAD